jgi:hypothetical protein
VKKEASVNLLTDSQEGRLTLRPADVLVYGRIREKHVCVYLIGVSPFLGLRVEDFTVGQSTLAPSKTVKHEKLCFDNQHIFILFAFDTFGFLAPEVVDLLKRVQNVMHNNVMSLSSMNVVF